MKQPRNEQGQFGQKDADKRKLRSLRLSDPTWAELGKIAEQYDISRSDVILKLLGQDNLNQGSQENEHLKQIVVKAIEELKKGLALKPNAKGAKNNKIRSALNILEKLI